MLLRVAEKCDTRLLEGQFILILPLTIDSLTTDPK
jgi:hypothetical protein